VDSLANFARSAFNAAGFNDGEIKWCVMVRAIRLRAARR
jgi:hypothetical protein